MVTVILVYTHMKLLRPRAVRTEPMVISCLMRLQFGLCLYVPLHRNSNNVRFYNFFLTYMRVCHACMPSCREFDDYRNAPMCSSASPALLCSQGPLYFASAIKNRSD